MKLTMANQCLRMGQLDQAEALFKQVLTGDPNNLVAIRSLGRLYAKQDKHDQAVSYLRRVVELQPDDADSHLKLAVRYKAREQFEQARSCFRRVLELEPRHLFSLLTLANTDRQTEYTNEIRTMEGLYQGSELGEHNRRRLAFALGKVFDDLGDYDKAFRYFVEGNRMARTKYWRSSKLAARLYQQIKTQFNTEFFRRLRGAGMADDSLIIIIGMPRSGTSLVEQILASHPDVHGAGEVEYLQRVVRNLSKSTGNQFPIGFDSIDAARMRDQLVRYLDELRGLANAEAHITDKNVGNISYVGLIGALLPNAKIIHCSRDPRDQGLSFFQKDFDERQPFSYDLEDIGHFHNRYQDMVEHWDRMLPGRIYRVQYEDVVADLNSGVRSMLDYCNLPFHAACLSFHNTDRLVGTASEIQVRQPLYTSSVGRWRNYEEHLQPLIAALGM